jgi:Transposase IS116/IS110/IS902 family
MSKLSTRNRTRSSHGELRPFEGMSKGNLSAAGVDIGAHEIMACVPDGDDHQIVRAFMRKWPDDKHFGSWLGLAPKNDISGDKVLRSRTMKHRNRAAQAFRMAAQSVLRSDCAFRGFYRRLKGRLGPAQALVATAHKIARTVYHMLKDRVPYHDIGAAEYNKHFRERELKYLQKKAAKLGYTPAPA